jgi:hypothetical protein
VRVRTLYHNANCRKHNAFCGVASVLESVVLTCNDCTDLRKLGSLNDQQPSWLVYTIQSSLLILPETGWNYELKWGEKGNAGGMEYSTQCRTDCTLGRETTFRPLFTPSSDPGRSPVCAKDCDRHVVCIGIPQGVHSHRMLKARKLWMYLTGRIDPKPWTYLS